MDSLLMILQYKLHIFTPLGHLRSTFMIDSNSNPSEPITISPHLKSNESSSESSKTTRRKNQKDEEELTVAGGGLGIRCVAWKPDGKLLAIGGYDDKVSSYFFLPWVIVIDDALIQILLLRSFRHSSRALHTIPFYLLQRFDF